MKKKLNILMLEDSADDAEIIQRTIIKSGLACSFFLTMNKESFLQAIEDFSPDVILSDNCLPQFSSSEALKITREKYPNIPFILVTGTVSEEYAVEITKSGADDYILKDRLARLPAAIDSAVHFRQSETQKHIAFQKLYNSEEKYRTLVGRITDAFIALDIQWNYNYVNIQAGEMFGKEPAALLGKNIWQVFPELETSPTAKAFRLSMKEQRYIIHHDYYPFLDMWLESHIYPSPDGLSVFIRNISETKMAEREIKKGNERFELVVSATNDVVWDWDIVNDSLWWNQNYYSHFGFVKNGKIPGIASRHDGICIQDRERVKTGIASIIENHQPVWTDEYSFLKADGTTCFILDCGHVLYDAENKPYRMVGAMLDITERKLAEEHVKESFAEKKAHAEKMTTILNALPANIALLDELGFIMEVNESWKLFSLYNGYNYSNFGIGENYITTAAQSIGGGKKEGQIVASGIESVLNRSLNEFVFEYSCDAPGIRRWFRMVVTPLNEKMFPGAVVMHVDISELRRLEQERLQSKMNEQKKITKAILEAQEKERNLIGEELHDNVNQILAGTKLQLSTAQNFPYKMPEIIVNSITNIQQAIEENRKIAHNLVTPNFKEISITDQLYNLTEEMLGKAGIEVHIDTSGLQDSLLEEEHKLMLYRIAQEQCTNIIKYAAAKKVTILVTTGQKTICRMVVSDDGNGVETGKTVKGIGLRNIKSRLHLYNGDVQIKTAPGKGFAITIEIPLHKNSNLPGQLPEVIQK